MQTNKKFGYNPNVSMVFFEKNINQNMLDYFEQQLNSIVSDNFSFLRPNTYLIPLINAVFKGLGKERIQELLDDLKSSFYDIKGFVKCLTLEEEQQVINFYSLSLITKN